MDIYRYGHNNLHTTMQKLNKATVKESRSFPIHNKFWGNLSKNLETNAGEAPPMMLRDKWDKAKAGRKGLQEVWNACKTSGNMEEALPPNSTKPLELQPSNGTAILMTSNTQKPLIQNRLMGSTSPAPPSSLKRQPKIWDCTGSEP